MFEIDKILKTIAECIQTNSYQEIETERLELKDLSTNENWDELYKTICAFLNTSGGIVIIGIKDKGNIKDKSQRHYQFKGFNYDLEPKVKEISKKFTDKNVNPLDLSIYFPTPELKDFAIGKILVLYVEELPQEDKFVFYQGKAYKRNITGDHTLTEDEIIAREQLKLDFIHAQELEIIPQIDLEVLDIDKLNQYILRINRNNQIEPLKADLSTARSFLERKSFVRENKPTLLGILVCGKFPFDYLGGRCEVDCYVDSKVMVAQNKQIIKGNIIELMESSVGFVYKNIQVGVSFANGGSSLPEYPEDLIRETVNNALAHRDYKNDKFVVINIKPNESIEISNPGFFLEKQKIFIDENIKTRRIIPITQVRNPKLADLLKSFDRLEARGKGLASLTNACLKNEIDMPYFILNQEHIRLFINKGKVYDDEMQVWLDSFSGHILAKNNQNELTEAEKIVLSYFYKSEKLNRLERYTILLTSDNNHFAIIADLEAKQLIYKHPHSSQIYPIYLVDRVLTKIEFSDELRQIFGQDYTNLGSDYKKVLNAIYQHNEYAAHKIVSANSIGTYLYLADNKRVMDIKHYENYKRKIRNIFHRLEEKQFIRRKVEQKPDFVINKSFSQLTVSMFDNQ